MSILRKILVAALAAGMLTGVALAAEAEIPDEHLTDVKEAHEAEISILCIGNSILNHGPSDSIGWSGSWGMAASSADKDYYHLLQGKVADAGYTNVSWSSTGLATFERTIDTRVDYDYASEIAAQLAPSVDKAKPDVVIFQIGENVSSPHTTDSYENALTMLAAYCKKVNPDVEVIFCKPFWGGTSKCDGAQNAALHLGYTYADLSQFNTADNKALGLFEHSGVASHPGDLGMENIAEEIFGQLETILYKKYVDPEQVAVKLDGRYLRFDVLPRLIDDRTMIPVRAVAEAFGAEVGWIDETETVTIDTDETKITMKLGEGFFTKNGKKIDLDVPAREIDGRTLVPARAIAEALDCEVDWDDATQTAYIALPVDVKAAAFPKAIDADPCNDTKTSGFYAGSSSKLTVAEDDEEHGKVIHVEATTDKKSWTYIWARMDLEPGKTYVIEADIKALPKNGAGDTIETLGIGFCLHYDNADHGVKMATGKVDEWTHVSFECEIPETMVKLPDNDAFGIFANPDGDVAGSFAVDNITVKVKE